MMVILAGLAGHFLIILLHLNDEQNDQQVNMKKNQQQKLKSINPNFQ